MHLRHPQQGFTLIEIILSMALTAMLLSLLSAGMYGVMNDWEDDTSALDERLDETVTILQVERALQGAFAHSYRNEKELARYVYFEGADETLSWVSTVSPQRSGGLMAWRLESVSGEGVTLQLAAAMSDNPDARLQNAERRLLLARYSARFRYLYEELDFSKRWRDDWPGADMAVLPLSVHIRLTPLDGKDTQELDIIAPIAANEHRSIRPNFAASNSSTAAPLGRRNPQLGAP